MNFLTDTLQDARYTLRQLRRNPFFSLTVIATLALALGATAALAGVLRATLLNPLPYPHASELVSLGDHNLKGFRSTGLMTVPRVGDLAAFETNGHELFSSVAFYYPDTSLLAVDGHEPLRLSSAAAAGAFFPTLATPALLGRTFTPADDVPNGPQLLVLSYHLWATTFAADPTVVGRSVRLGTEQATILGVMPEHFAYPAATDFWHPAHLFPATFNYRGDGVRYVQAVARLNVAQDPALTDANATQALQRLAALLAKQHPDTDAAWDFTLTSLRDSLFGEYHRALLLLSLVSALVLLVAAINIAGLQLSRNLTRTPEFSIRRALGIGRARLARQLLTESLLLVLAGSAAGLALAVVLLRVLSTRLPAALLSVETPHIDRSVLALAFTLALVVAVFTALAPIFATTRLRASTTIGSNTGDGPRHARLAVTGRLFALLQIALSLVLLTLSAGVLSSLYELLNRPLGYAPEHLVTATTILPWGTPPAHADQVTRQAEAAFADLPGVTAAGAASALPLSSFTFRRTFDIAGQAPTPHHDAIAAESRDFTRNYLGTMHIPLLAGRSFTTSDEQPGAPPVVVINQTLAHKYFPQTSPVGQHLVTGFGVNEQLAPVEIVGVVGDVEGTGGSLLHRPQPEVYGPAIDGSPRMQFALRTTLPPAELEPQLRRALASIDGTAFLGKISTLQFTLDANLAQPRLNAGLLAGFAALSLLLVIIGVYGLVAFDVAQRTRELGLRIALGSTRTGVLTLLLSESTRILAAGLALGLLASYVTARLLTSLLVGTARQSLSLTLATTVLLALAVLAATYLPARRASQLDPMEALKTT